MKITLPTNGGNLQPYTLQGPGRFVPARSADELNRIAYSAAHVVADPRAAIDPWLQCAIDWDATIGYRFSKVSPPSFFSVKVRDCD
jgi:hypothetical protein